MTDGTEIYGIEWEVWAQMGWQARFEVVRDTLDEQQEELDRLRRGVRTIWEMCHTCTYVDTIEDELEHLMNGHEPVKHEEPKGYVSKREKRLIEWITRIATWKIPRNAGYFARVFKLEAKAILEGKDVPSKPPDRPYTSRPNVKFYDFGLPHEKGPTNESDQTP